MQLYKQKEAFTLPELLVTVVVIGILAAVALPRIYNAAEQRKTTEAEEILAALRTEQEKRCVLDKRYITDFAVLPGILANEESKYFRYELLPTGAEAHRKGGYGYVLRMPSYEDGRICCEDAKACQRLRKDYPTCTDLTARADYRSGEECSPVKKTALCQGPDTRPCGCQEQGQQTRTCDPATDTWSDWGSCSIALTCDCSAVSGPRPAPQEQPCPQGGTQSRGFSCDTLTGQWFADPWGECRVTQETSAPQTSTEPAEQAGAVQKTVTAQSAEEADVQPVAAQEDDARTAQTDVLPAESPAPDTPAQDALLNPSGPVTEVSPAPEAPQLPAASTAPVSSVNPPAPAEPVAPAPAAPATPAAAESVSAPSTGTVSAVPAAGEKKDMPKMGMEESLDSALSMEISLP